MRSFLSLTLLLLLTTGLKAELVVSQSFEAGEAVNYTIDPATYNTGSDVWAIADTIGFGGDEITASVGTNFWAMRDLDNPNGGGPDAHTLTFDSIDISNFTDVVVSFDYNVFEFDAGDNMFVSINGDVTQLIEGVNNGGTSTTGWASFSLDIDDSVDTLDVVLSAEQNGGNDWAGWDNFQVNGVAAVPEPSSIAVLGLVGAAAARRYRKRRKA